MTSQDSNEVDEVVELARCELDDPRDWVKPTGYPNDIEASILDAVFSSRAVYSDNEDRGPRGVVKRWKARTDKSMQLEDYRDDPEGLRSILDNDAKQNGRHKSDIAAEIAQSFATHDPVLRTVGAIESNMTDAKRRWTAVHGAGPATFHYFCLLLGLPDVKADTWVIRFVTRALDQPKGLSTSKAQALVLAAADEMGVNPIHLDHAIWRHERRQAQPQ